MNTKTNLKASFANPKSRIFLFFMIAVIIVVGMVAYTSRNRTINEQKNDAGITASSSVVNPGASVESIPGTTDTSAEYQELQRKKYEEISKQALTDKGQPVAALPSLSTGSENLSAIPGLTPKDSTNNYTDKLQQQVNDQAKAQQDIQARQNDLLAKQQIDAANQKAQDLMARQISLLARNWQIIPQQFVPGKPTVYPANIKPGDHILPAQDSGDKKPKIYYKAGDILFGILLTSVNSDQPGPILARIVSGPLNGSKIVGTINPATIPQTANAPKVSKTLILEFTLINIPGKRISVPITAVAIDPQTANTGLATSVDNHYLLRYGTFFAANFLSGIGQAISSQNQAKIITSSGTADIGRTTGLNPQEETKIAIGKTAEAFTKSLNFLDTPPTIRVSSGTALGILLQNDLIIQGDNTEQLVNQAAVANQVQRALIPSGAPVGYGPPGGVSPMYNVSSGSGAVIGP